ncbi:MAG: bifunctional phosphopantothenoylcysteine decarboxylase/phosphopantothenate--cysteine ligase CoaBC [Candidatus Thorarchaeota archaeon]
MFPVDHTSKLIIGSQTHLLAGKRIVLCVTGSVAAVQCVELARQLMRWGAEVYCVMSRNARTIIHPYLLEWATGNYVVTRLTGRIEHVTLAGSHEGHADLVLVAPATANTIGKIANGIDDTPVTTTVSSAIGARIPVIVVPAMHRSMYDHPAVIENIEKLRHIGVKIVQPRLEEAKAKFPSLTEIVEAVYSSLVEHDLEGKRVVVTAGPTRGWIDRVRFMTNPSSGKMGIEIAKEALARGADVTLILGPSQEIPPEQVRLVRVDSTREMRDAVIDAIQTNGAEVLISAAAVLDFEPEKREERKRPSGEDYSIKLVSTPKIIDEARERFPGLFIVGFKLESGLNDDQLCARAREKIESGVCDLVVANDERRSGAAFGSDTNEVLVVGPEGLIRKIGPFSKREVARGIVDTLVQKLRNTRDGTKTS